MRELKSKQVNFVVRPTLYELVKTAAFIRHETVSGLLDGWMRQYVNDNADILRKYVETFPEDDGGDNSEEQ